MTTSFLYAIFDGFDSDFEEDRYLLAVYVNHEEAQRNAEQYCEGDDWSSIQIVEFPVGTPPSSPSSVVVFDWNPEEGRKV